ncbi:armadillo-type protein [Mycena galopus ATCC 62051]|nr:armadillo-type protein [Mycena galopus ATCC 62051]
MQPLSRQESRPSIYSWWSDSNPGLQGPTINLHAAAKPLSRFLYHRQVLDIITKNSGIPLSALTLEIYSSYFPLDYVSWSTKATILAELADRSTSEVEARAVVDSPVFPYVAQMLGSPDPGVRISSCRLLGCLLLQESTAPAVLELQPWEQLVSLLSDKRPRVSGVAASVLCELSKSTADAQAIVNANATDHIFMLLGSPNPETLRETCELVERLASHDSTAPAILKLVARIMRYEDSWVIGWAVNILSTMAQSEDGAQAIIDANTTNHILILLQSPRSGVRELACELVERLASRKCIAPVMERIVILL